MSNRHQQDQLHRQRRETGPRDLDARDVSDDTTDVEAAGTPGAPPWWASTVPSPGEMTSRTSRPPSARNSLNSSADTHGDEPELTWQIDSGAEASRQVPLNPM
jgi:hypothetical protein